MISWIIRQEGTWRMMELILPTFLLYTVSISPALTFIPLFLSSNRYLSLSLSYMYTEAVPHTKLGVHVHPLTLEKITCITETSNIYYAFVCIHVCLMKKSYDLYWLFIEADGSICKRTTYHIMFEENEWAVLWNSPELDTKSLGSLLFI